MMFDAEEKGGHLHGEHDNANTPAVHQVAITRLLIRLHDNFRCEIARGATHGLSDGVKLIQQKGNHATNLQESIAVDNFCEPKVRNLYDGWVVRSQQHVLREQDT